MPPMPSNDGRPRLPWMPMLALAGLLCLSACTTEVVGKSDAYNELYVGNLDGRLAGRGTLELHAVRSRATCSGPWRAFPPTGPDLWDREGVFDLACSDRRRLRGRWVSLNRREAMATTQDQLRHNYTFRVSADPRRAGLHFQDYGRLQADKPPMPKLPATAIAQSPKANAKTSVEGRVVPRKRR